MNDETILIKDELLKVGIEVNNIYDLVNTNKSYAEVIPVLINLIQIVNGKREKEGIIRALTVKEAKGIANKVLLNEFYLNAKKDLSLLWVIGNAMSIIATKEDIKELIDIVRDKSYGTSRQMFVLALGKFKTDEVENVLISLLDDNDIVLHVLSALGKIKSQKAITKILEIEKYSKGAKKKEAIKALKRINNIK